MMLHIDQASPSPLTAGPRRILPPGQNLAQLETPKIFPPKREFCRQHGVLKARTLKITRPNPPWLDWGQT